MQVSQIYISDGNTALSPYLQQCVEAAKHCFPNFRHVLYDESSLKQFLIDNFDTEVVAAYDKLNPYAYKADLGRYCLLYAIGGWYFDVSVKPVASISVPENIESIAFRDRQIVSATSWACCNAANYSKKGNPVFQTAIQKVIQNCKNEYYGVTPLCPTGPTVLGEAFALHGARPNRVFGDYQYLTPNHPNKNLAYVLPDGMIFALGNPDAGGGLKKLGTTGTNNYGDMYFSRTVYKSQSGFQPTSATADSPTVLPT